jgi:uroporphyrin-III C-methyltransferase
MSDISTMQDPTINPESPKRLESLENLEKKAAMTSNASPHTAVSHSHVGNTGFSKIFTIFMIAALAVSMLASFYLWRKLTNMQEHLARQSADATNLSVEARGLAKNAQDVAREASARSSLNETRLSEVALQRSQLDELMQSLSRSRDENLVVDIDSALRLAQQQAQLTGSVEPLLSALKTADQRLLRAAQPRLNAVRKALASDIDKIKAAAVTDIPSLLVKLDEIGRLVEDLPVLNTVTAVVRVEKSNASLNAVGVKSTAKVAVSSQDADWQSGLQKFMQSNWQIVRAELVKLVRVSRIENPDAVLLSPEQTYFFRENLKLKILNARLGLLGRQIQSAKTDLAGVADDVRKYGDPTSKQSQLLQTALSQVQSQLGNASIPALDASLAALTTVAALAVAGK